MKHKDDLKVFKRFTSVDEMMADLNESWKNRKFLEKVVDFLNFNIWNKINFLFRKSTYVYFFQRRFRGWDDSDTWSLDYVIAKFIVPRLKRFKELKTGWPNNIVGESDKDCEEQWNQILDKMIRGFEWILMEDDYVHQSFQDNKLPYDKKMADVQKRLKKVDREVKEGLDLFKKYFRGLWS